MRRAVLAACALVALLGAPAVARADGAPVGAEPLWPDLSKAAPVEAMGANDAAIIVAIESYAVLPKVRGAVDNGTLWFQYFLEQRKIPEANVQFLRNGDATVETIPAAVAAAAARAKAGGKVWFVFIGHGGPAKDQKDGVLVGFDAQQNPQSLYARSVLQRDLLDALSKSAAQPVAIVDACFSGLSARYDTETQAIAEGVQPTIPVEVLYTTPVVVLSAGKADEFAGRLPGARRPAFSYLLLGALRGWADENHDGSVTAAEAVSYARAKLATLPIHRTQTPQLSAVDPNLVLAKGVSEAGPSIPAIVAKLPEDDTALDTTSRGIGTSSLQEPGAESSRSHWGTQKTVALVAGGVGIAGAVVGGVFAAKAVSANSDSKAECNPAEASQCTAKGASLRADAYSAANVATVGAIVAGVGIAAGAVLWFTAPSGEVKVGVGPRGIAFEGRF